MGAVRKVLHKGPCSLSVLPPTENDDYGQFQNTGGQKNEDGFNIYVTRQQPEAICEKQKHNQELIQEIRKSIERLQRINEPSSKL